MERKTVAIQKKRLIKAGYKIKHQKNFYVIFSNGGKQVLEAIKQPEGGVILKKGQEELRYDKVWIKLEEGKLIVNCYQYPPNKKVSMCVISVEIESEALGSF